MSNAKFISNEELLEIERKGLVIVGKNDTEYNGIGGDYPQQENGNCHALPGTVYDSNTTGGGGGCQNILGCFNIGKSGHKDA